MKIRFKLPLNKNEEELEFISGIWDLFKNVIFWFIGD